VCVDILHFSRSCGRHAEDCACRVTICTHFLLIIICHFHLVLLACWVSRSSHILLLVKHHAHQYVLIETTIKRKSLCLYCHATFYGPLDTLTGVWMHERRFEHNTTDTKHNTKKLNLIYYVLKLIEYIKADKAFTQNCIVITRWQQISPSLPQQAHWQNNCKSVCRN
jgi:hypothetical protein